MTATVDGLAHHIVQEFHEQQDGHASWQALLEWYDGSIMRNETASNLRSKLDNLQLNALNNASQCINKFMELHRELQHIPGEVIPLDMQCNHAHDKITGRSIAGLISFSMQ